MSKRLIWDDEKIALLKQLIERKVSLTRAAVILKCSQSTAQVQARKLGTPFAGIRKTRAMLRKSIADAEHRAGLTR
jgi:hypothetical protein